MAGHDAGSPLAEMSMLSHHNSQKKQTPPFEGRGCLMGIEKA
jgi:hypothetical protein